MLRIIDEDKFNKGVADAFTTDGVNDPQGLAQTCRSIFNQSVVPEGEACSGTDILIAVCGECTAIYLAKDYGERCSKCHGDRPRVYTMEISDLKGIFSAVNSK